MKKFIPVIAVISIVLSSCGAYNGAIVSMPTIRQQGEWHLEGAVSPWPLVEVAPPFGHVSAAVGLTDHVAVAANADATRLHAQIMGGAYFPVDEKFVWEVYGGAGLGHGTNDSDSWASKKEDYVDYRVGFVQADCGWRNLTRFLHIDVSLGLKTGLLFYDREMRDDASGEYRYSAGKNMVFSPMVEVRFGWEHVKFNLKAAKSLMFGIAGSEVLEMAPVDVGVGVDVFLPMRKKRK